MIKILRKVNISVKSTLFAALALGSISIYSPEALAQSYPTKPIRIVIAAAAGSSSDMVARLIGAKLSEALGQQIIVDPRAGASGRIGAEVAARAAPDGYTLLLMTSQHACVDAMYKKDIKYDLVKDFAPISLVGRTPSILVVNPSVPATSVKELVTLAKSRPGALKYGSIGSGSSSHLPAVIFKFMTGIDILHVPYKAAPTVFASVMSGEVDMYFSAVTVCLPVVKTGRIRALGVTGLKRTTLAPDLPSISETVPGYEFMSWQGLVAPAKTPPAIISKLNSEVVKALNTPVVREQMAAIGNEPLGSSQQGLALHISEQLKKMREAVELSGAKPED